MSYKNQWPTNRLLSTAARLVEHAWNENLASLGITHAGVMALDVLRSEGSMTQAQLAHQVRVQAQTMGKTLHRYQVAKDAYGIGAILMGEINFDKLPGLKELAHSNGHAEHEGESANPFKVKCPECESVLSFSEGCVKCPSCGYSKC